MPENISLLLNKIEAKGKQPSVLEVLKFQLQCLMLINHKFSPIAGEAFEVGKDYASGKAEIGRVNETRVRCWEYLDSNLKGESSANLEVSCIRAVIFALPKENLADEDKDVVDSLSLFLQFVNNVESHH